MKNSNEYFQNTLIDVWWLIDDAVITERTNGENLCRTLKAHKKQHPFIFT